MGPIANIWGGIRTNKLGLFLPRCFVHSEPKVFVRWPLPPKIVLQSRAPSADLFTTYPRSYTTLSSLLFLFYLRILVIYPDVSGFTYHLDPFNFGYLLSQIQTWFSGGHSHLDIDLRLPYWLDMDNWRVAVLGDGGVGKTALAVQVCNLPYRVVLSLILAAQFTLNCFVG